MLMKENKRSILYLNLIKNIDSMMNIEKYLKLNLEMSLMKDVLFDDHQKIVFDTVTNISNVNRLFGENKFNDNLSEYKKETILNEIKLMNSRNNNIDKNMLSLI